MRSSVSAFVLLSTLVVHTTIAQDLSLLLAQKVPIWVSGITDGANVDNYLNTQNADGTWPDVDYTTGCDARRANWPAQDHWHKLVTLSAAYAPGLEGMPQYVGNSTVWSAISKGMDWWFDRDFTVPGCLGNGGTASCPCGTPGLWNTNWFSNIILIPLLAGESCLLLNSTITPTQRGVCTNITSRAYGTFDSRGMTGANALDTASIGLLAAMLAGDDSVADDAYRRVRKEVVVYTAPKADGIRPDGSFGQHTGVLYDGNYGNVYTNDILVLELSAIGTRWEANSTSHGPFETHVDGFQWMIFKNVVTGVLHWDFSVLGRMIAFAVSDNQPDANIGLNLTQLLDLGNHWDSSIISGAASRLMHDSDSANVQPISGNRMFYDNDYMVHAGSGYMTSVKMFSTRTLNGECVNSGNLLGYHLSDGTVYTRLTGDEYEDIPASWDWNLIPGTTTDYGATPLSCATLSKTGLQAFVGGVSTGQIGIAVMNYTNPTTKNLNWRKAWFFLPNDVQHVTIAGITSASQAPVYSSLDTRKHISDVYVNSQVVSGGNFTDISLLWHGNIGYAFDNSSSFSEVAITTGNRTGDWTLIGTSTSPPTTFDLFTAYIHHDPSNLAKPVSYTVYPVVSSATDLVAKHASSKPKTLSNDASTSSVLDASGTVMMAVFWAAGEIVVPFSVSLLGETATLNIRISSDHPVAIIVDAKQWQLTASDPSQKLTTATIGFAVDAQLFGPILASIGLVSKNITVQFPTSAADLGKSVTMPLTT